MGSEMCIRDRLELYPPAEEETDDGQTEPESTESEGSEPTDAPESEVE